MKNYYSAKAMVRHFDGLARVFQFDTQGVNMNDYIKSLYRLEARAHRLAELECNGDIDEATAEKKTESIRKALKKLLPYRAEIISFNGDPRGHALKIKASNEFVKMNPEIFICNIQKDMGGVYIIAPDFN